MSGSARRLGRSVILSVLVLMVGGLVLFHSTKNQRARPAEAQSASGLGRPVAQTAEASVTALANPSTAATAPASDPARGLPAELSSAELQKVGSDLEYLEASWEALKERDKAFDADLKVILSDNVTQALWNRFRGPGFKDKTLLLDWNRLFKDTPTDVPLFQSLTPSNAVFEQYRMLLGTPSEHIDPIRVRLLGGELFNEDLAYIRHMQLTIDTVDKAIDAAEPAIASFFARFNAEYPAQTIPFSPIAKLDVHAANLSPELIGALVQQIDHASGSIETLKTSAAAYRVRRLRFRNTMQAVAIAGGDEDLFQKVSSSENPPHVFNPHGRSRPVKGSLIHKDLMKCAWDTVRFEVPDASGESVGQLEILARVRGLALQEHSRLTVSDLRAESQVERWIAERQAAIKTASTKLDEIQKLVIDEDPLVQWDASPRSFAGEGHAPLDREYQESPVDWDQELTAFAKRLGSELWNYDERLRREVGTDLTHLLAEINERLGGYRLYAMPPLWRHEIRERIFANGAKYFGFTVGPDFQLITAVEDVTPASIEGAVNEWIVPCKVQPAGDVLRVLLVVDVENFPLHDTKNTFNYLYFFVKSDKSGNAVDDAPKGVDLQLYMGAFRKGPASLEWDASDKHFDAAKEAAAGGMRIVVKSGTPGVRLTKARVIVNHLPPPSTTQSATVK